MMGAGAPFYEGSFCFDFFFRFAGEGEGRGGGVCLEGLVLRKP